MSDKACYFGEIVPETLVKGNLGTAIFGLRNKSSQASETFWPDLSVSSIVSESSYHLCGVV